jgi:RNA polymerase sigma-70 factor (ECF subfamily)
LAKPEGILPSSSLKLTDLFYIQVFSKFRQPYIKDGVLEISGCLMISDQKIVEGCKAGKHKAYSMLYRKYSAIMLGLCLRYCKNLQEAEDVLQEGFIKVFNNISKFREEGSFEGWIKRIMINCAIDHYQKNLKHSFHDNLEKMNEKIGEEEEPEGKYEELGIEKEELMQMIQELPDGYRIVFNMYAIEGYSHRDIAASLSISENTSKTQLMKARRVLRERLEKIIKARELNKLYK